MKWIKINNVKTIDSDLRKINKIKGPVFVEVVTMNKQKIIDSFGYTT